MKLLARALAIPALVFLASPVHADANVETRCFETAAHEFQLDEDLLLAIAKVESDFRPRALHYDSDGTYDVGVMQINSSHLPRLRARNITEDTLLGRPCTNVAVGAEILAGFVHQFGPTWRAVGAYGAGTQSTKEEARRTYAALVAGALAAIRSARRQRPNLVAASQTVHMLVEP